MALSLSSFVIEMAGIGPHRAKILEKLRIRQIRDLLFDFPRRYEDFSIITSIDRLEAGKTMTVKGRVKRMTSKYGWRGRQRLLRIFADIEDDTGVLAVTWFNLRFLPKQLWTGREINVAGTVEINSNKTGFVPTTKFRMRSPVIEFPDASKELTHTGRITPIYAETHGITSRFLRYQIKQSLPLVASLKEYLPAAILRRHKLMPINEAIREAHFPQNRETLDLARQRLRFDELFFLQLAALLRLKQRQGRQAYRIDARATLQAEFVNQLPFKLTGAQTAALADIATDIGRPVPMNRLLQGDVGSGKSVVALFAAFAALKSDLSVLYLAPTEILARQQAKLFQDFLGRGKAILLVSATSASQKREIKQRLASSEALCAIGTHALLQDDVQVRRYGLAIIDEQHRFGVVQRRNLQAVAAGHVPHLLSMTATPIPRTLTLTVYGDLEVSVLNELPPGRSPVKTAIVGQGQRDEAITHVLSELHRGRQAYVIAPLVEESEKLALKSAKSVAVEMTKLFPDVAVGLLHGQMKPEEKASVLNNFAAGALQLLVATAIVEVGVNVPNASIMIIEGAERFGLAQLHQFRGRIGRDKYQSYCYLFPSTDEATASKRLEILVQTNDGFQIAEADLELRGPGEVYGVAQSGFANLQVASLLDYPTIKAARSEAKGLLDSGELDSYPLLRQKAEQKNLLAHFE